MGGCVQSKPVYRAKRRKNRRSKGQNTRTYPVQRQNISPQYPNDGSYPVYQDYGEEQRVMNNEQALREHPPTRNPSQFEPNTEYMGIEDDERPAAQQGMASPQQKRFNSSTDTTARNSQIPVVHESYVAPENRGTSIPRNYAAPDDSDNKIPVVHESYVAPENRGKSITKNYAAAADSVTKPEQQVPPLPPHGVTNAGEAMNTNYLLASRGVSPVRGGEEGPENYGAHTVVMNNTTSPPEFAPRSNTTLKRELESLSKQVDVEQIATSPPTAVTATYKVPPNSETEYDKPEEKLAEVMDPHRRTTYLSDNSTREVLDSQRRTTYQEQPPEQNDPYAPIGKPEVWVPRTSESAESRSLRVKDTGSIGSICIDASTGEYRYYQHGVHLGNVDKETAEKFSKNWPICPGTAAKPVKNGAYQRRVPRHQPNGSSKITHVSPLEPQNNTGSQVYWRRGGPIYHPTGGYRGENNGYSNSGYREQVAAQPAPGYRGYIL